MKILNLSPLTLKRIKKFKKTKRAYYSFLILVSLFVISLFSEFIANKKPLILKFNGNYYFPILKFYPESEFKKNGYKTEINYKEFTSSTIFKKNKKNFCLFSLIPYGPFEIENQNQILNNTIEIYFQKKDIIYGYIYVNKNLEITKFNSSISKLFSQKLKKNLNLSKILKENSIEKLKNHIFFNKNDKNLHILTTLANKKIYFKYNNIYKKKYGYKIKFFSDSEKFFQPFKILIDRDYTILETDDNLSYLLGINTKKKKLKFNEIIQKSKIIQKKLMINNLKNFLNESSNKNQTFEIHSLTNNKKHTIEIQIKKEKMRFPFRPNKNHLLGIDEAGRDVLVRLIYGFRISMIFGSLLVCSSIFFGIIIGSIQGYLGGKIDIIFQRLIEIWSAVPFLYVIILLGDVFGKGFLLLLICYSLFNWISISYYIRAEFLKLKKFQFVEAAKSLGIPWWKIVYRHILPNSLTPIITFFPFSLMSAIASLSALDYLGYGLPAPTPSWGELLSQAQNHRFAWWLILYPAIALFITMLLTVFIGEGVREAFDPKKFFKYE